MEIMDSFYLRMNKFQLIGQRMNFIKRWHHNIMFTYIKLTCNSWNMKLSKHCNKVRGTLYWEGVSTILTWRYAHALLRDVSFVGFKAETCRILKRKSKKEKGIHKKYHHLYYFISIENVLKVFLKHKMKITL